MVCPTANRDLDALSVADRACAPTVDSVTNVSSAAVAVFVRMGVIVLNVPSAEVRRCVYTVDNAIRAQTV
jgi:hypothetical protein